MGTIFIQTTSNRTGCSAVLPVDLNVFVRAESIPMAGGEALQRALRELF